MSAAFTDSTGRVWPFALTVAGLEKLSAILGGKAFDSSAFLRAVYLDLEKFREIVGCVLGDPAAIAAVATLDGAGYAALQEAFTGEYLGFFPPAVRAEIQETINRTAKGKGSGLDCAQHP